MPDKISIIIPVYNVEPYVSKCLTSVINQTYSNLEIICINDGSTDNSGVICDEFAEKDCRIKVIHKTNGGVSSAKNLGLKHATGQYIGFVDSDDWIEPDMYEVLYSTLKENNVHISISPYFKATDTDSVPMLNNAPIPAQTITARNMLLFLLQRNYYMGFCGYMWNKLFAADIFKANSLSFDKNIKYGEDVLLFAKIALTEKYDGFYVNKPLYHYYQRNTAVTKTKSVALKTDILLVYKTIENLLNCNGYSDISYWARGFYCYHASTIAELAMLSNDTETLQLMQKEIKNHLDDYIRTNEDFPQKFERMYRLIGS